MPSRLLLTLLAAAASLAALAVPASAQPARGVGASELITDEAQRDALIGKLDSLGAEWARLNVNMEYMLPAGRCGRQPAPNPAPGQNECSIDWSRGYAHLLDVTVKKLHARGIQTLGVAVGSPCWARPSTPCPAAYDSTRPDPSYFEYYNRFLRLVVERLSGHGLRGIEVWNEANSVAFWGGSPDAGQYARLLAGANRAIRDEASRLGVGRIAVGIAGPVPVFENRSRDGIRTLQRHRDWLNRVYSSLPSPARAHYDFIGVHPYPKAPDSSAWLDLSGSKSRAGVADQVIDVRRDAVAHPNGAARPLWLTEIGYTACDQLGLDGLLGELGLTRCDDGSWRQVTEDEQARLLDDTVKLVEDRRWIRGLFVFNLSSQPEYRGTWWYGAGLITERMKERRGYRYLQCRWAPGTAQGPCASEVELHASPAEDGRTLRGGPGSDTLRGGSGDDKLIGRGGNDRLGGRGGNDRIGGGPGRDLIKAGGGRDLLKGGGGNDRLFGGPGRDRIDCGPGRDRVLKQGRDRISRNCEIVKNARGRTLRRR